MFYHATLENSNMRYMFYRPKTAIEQRAIFWNCLIHGAKGFLYDGDWNANFEGDYGQGQMGLGDNTLVSDSDDLYEDEVGTDFIDYDYDVWKVEDYINLSNVSSEMGVDSDRVYIGMKSIRTELLKFNSYLRAVESDLMDLRLAASYCKGYREWYNQDTTNYGSQNLLSEFINIDSVYTKKIWNPVTHCSQVSKESWDSTFIDITLLRSISDNNMDSLFYIGIQNKRTDPLINERVAGDGPYAIKFFSTAEYDLGIASDDSTLWKDRWHKRLGCRTIKIPFIYRYSANADEFTVLKITELGADNQNLTLKYFRDPDLNHLIDTTISADGSLVVNMLPGQGKIFKVEVSYSPKFSGYLNHSNQRNMVIYPTDNESLTWKDEIDDVRYHSVYFKQIPASNPERFGVYYRRSEIMDGTFLYKTPFLVGLRLGLIQQNETSSIVVTV